MSEVRQRCKTKNVIGRQSKNFKKTNVGRHEQQFEEISMTRKKLEQEKIRVHLKKDLQNQSKQSRKQYKSKSNCRM